jgi:hypothetical protein
MVSNPGQSQLGSRLGSRLGTRGQIPIPSRSRNPLSRPGPDPVKLAGKGSGHTSRPLKKDFPPDLMNKHHTWYPRTFSDAYWPTTTVLVLWYNNTRKAKLSPHTNNNGRGWKHLSQIISPTGQPPHPNLLQLTTSLLQLRFQPPVQESASTSPPTAPRSPKMWQGIEFTDTEIR